MICNHCEKSTSYLTDFLERGERAHCALCGRATGPILLPELPPLPIPARGGCVVCGADYGTCPHMASLPRPAPKRGPDGKWLKRPHRKKVVIQEERIAVEAALLTKELEP